MDLKTLKNRGIYYLPSVNYHLHEISERKRIERDLVKINKEIKVYCVDPVLESEDLSEMRFEIFDSLALYKMYRNDLNEKISEAFEKNMLSQKEYVRSSVLFMEKMQNVLEEQSHNLLGHIVHKAKKSINICCEINENLPLIDFSQTSMGLLTRFVGESDVANLLITCYSYDLTSKTRSQVFNYIVNDLHDLLIKYCETIRSILEEMKLKQEKDLWDEASDQELLEMEK